MYDDDMAIWAQMAIDSICWDECFDECDECGVAASFNSYDPSGDGEIRNVIITNIAAKFIGLFRAAGGDMVPHVATGRHYSQVNLTIKKVMTRQLIDHPDLSFARLRSVVYDQ